MNVFLVGAPHQLLNALEARNSLGFTHNHLVVSLSETYSRAAFEPMLREYSWDHVEFVNAIQARPFVRTCSKSSPWLQRILWVCDSYGQRVQLDRIARRVHRPDRVVLGNYGMIYMRHFANRVGSSEILLLDDGTATLGFNQERKRLSTGEPRSDGKQARRQRIRKRLGFDSSPLAKVTYFTTYDFDVVHPDSIIKNSYTFLRGLAASHAALDEVFFCGQPLVEDGLLTMDSFLAQVRRVKAHYGNANLVYLPHKRERSEKVSILQSELRLALRSFDVPIEYQMSARGTRPKILASFFSSALENSRIIFGPLLSIQCFRIEPTDFLYRQEEIASIYTHFAGKSSAHFELIE
jgi:hypothetical protein